MANKKITELSPVATMTSTDVIPIVTDVSTVPVTKKISGLNLTSFFRNTFKNEYVNADGWIPANETWTYVSATSFSISGDVTYKYQKGDKIKMGQSGTKYFYVLSVAYSSPNTIVTVTGGSDYTIAAAGISLNYFSKVENPYGFPQWFNYTLAWTASTTNPAIVNGTIAARFKIAGRTCFVNAQINMGASTTYGSGNYSFSLPLTAANVGVSYQGQVSCYDSSASQFFARLLTIDPAQTVMTYITPFTAGGTGLYMTQAVPFTWASGDFIRIHAEYEV